VVTVIKEVVARPETVGAQPEATDLESVRAVPVAVRTAEAVAAHHVEGVAEAAEDRGVSARMEDHHYCRAHHSDVVTRSWKRQL